MILFQTYGRLRLTGWVDLLEIADMVGPGGSGLPRRKADDFGLEESEASGSEEGNKDVGQSEDDDSGAGGNEVYDYGSMNGSREGGSEGDEDEDDPEMEEDEQVSHLFCNDQLAHRSRLTTGHPLTGPSLLRFHHVEKVYPQRRRQTSTCLRNCALPS